MHLHLLVCFQATHVDRYCVILYFAPLGVIFEFVTSNELKLSDV
jgi:hypothetical protein